MAIKTFRLDERPTDISIGIYGPTGVGKTTLVGTMPGRGVIIDVPQVEGGTFVISDKAERISGIRIEEWDEIEEIYWALAKRDTTALPFADKVRWIAIDSITGMQVMAKRKIIHERDRSLGEDPHKVTLPEWGAIGSLVGELVYRFRKLPYATIWTAQERTHGGGEDDPGPVRIGPAIIRSALAAFAPSMTILGRLSLKAEEEGKEQRILRVGPSGGDYVVKARTTPSKRLPYLIREPNLKALLRYLYGNGPRPKQAREDDQLSFS